jgi:hypothetical protein
MQYLAIWQGVLEGYKWEFRAWNKVLEKREFSCIYKRKMVWKTLLKDVFGMMHLRLYQEQSKCSFKRLEEIHPNFVLTLEDIMINSVHHQ